MSHRLAILIGNGSFAADPSLAELAAPRRDVAALGRLLSDPDLGNYRVSELVDCNRARLQQEIEPLLAAAVSGANVLVYYAGYVVHEPGRGLFLATAETRLDAVKDTALPMSALKGLLRRSGASDITVVLDCGYVSPSGRVDASDVEHELRRVRGDVSRDLHLIAAPAGARAREDRESAAESAPVGAMTRCIIDGLASGAADRDGDNTTTASDLNEYLGMRMGDDRPLWAGPLQGADPEILSNPHPIEGIEPVARAEIPGEREKRRRLLVGAAGFLLLIAIVIGGAYLLAPPESRAVVRLDAEYRGDGLPETVARVSDLDLLRAMIGRTGWVEHAEPLDGGGARYPDLVTFSSAGGGDQRPGDIDLRPGQGVGIDFADGVQGFGIVCARGFNAAEVVVELAGGERYAFDVRSDRPDRRFYGFVSRQPLRRLRISSTSAPFFAEALYVYADREHDRVRGGRP
jgi:hypothetical protein